MPIDGITLEQDGNWNICYINEFSDELKDIIRNELNVICYGKNHVDEADDYYSYTKTLKEFLNRYNPKPESTKKGMIGELLSHLLIKQYKTNLETISIFFNKEERSIRKGFDLNYIEAAAASIWYGEVKSGNKRDGIATDATNKALLANAKTDVSEKLTPERVSIWESVITDADLNFKLERGIEIKELLRGDVVDIESDQNAKKRVIVVSVLYHDCLDKISAQSIREFCDSVIGEDIFEDVIVFTIQKSTLERIEKFLREECAD